jgi:hypothetical protein
MNLTTTQLAAIDRHLRQANWLLNDALIAELTDHYANAVAEKLAQGVAFEPALTEVQASFGGRAGLLKMEEDFAFGYFLQGRKTFHKVFWSYFHPLRFVAIIGLFFGLLHLIEIAPRYGRYMLIAGGLSGLAFVIMGYVSVILIGKLRQHKQKAYYRLRGFHLGIALLGFGGVNFMAIAVEFFLPIHIYEANETVIVALICTLVFVYLCTAVEYAIKMRKHITPA